MYLGHQKSRHWFKSYDGEKWIISSNGATPSSYLVLLDMRLTCAGKSLSDLSQHPGALTSPNFLFLVPLITLVTQVTSKTAIAKTCCRVCPLGLQMVWLICKAVKGSSHMMSAENGGCQPKIRNWPYTPPPLVMKNKKIGSKFTHMKSKKKVCLHTKG